MAATPDQDRYFLGQVDASTPRAVLSEGVVSRLINASFVEGAISNATAFTELSFIPSSSLSERVDGRRLTYKSLLSQGDIQLAAPLSNVKGDFLILIINGRLLQLDINSGFYSDITPRDTLLPDSSYYSAFPLSYINNDGEVSGTGGYLVIFNYPNRPIFVGPDGARLSDPLDFETPPSRMGATGGNRAVVVSGNNLLYVSDPLGGSSSLAPLTFRETLDLGPPAADYFGQILTVGSVLDLENITAIARMISLFTPSTEFLASSIIIFTENKKYIFSIGVPRAQWDAMEIIRYAGSNDGAAGPLAITNVGSMLVYMTSDGRIRNLAQDNEKDNALTETSFDSPLGQYLCCGESTFHFRRWYKDLNHSMSVLKFMRNRLYATTDPMVSSALNLDNKTTRAPSHRALAIARLSDEQAIGPRSILSWEGFYDWVYPNSIVTLKRKVYVVSKDPYGINRIYVEDHDSLDPHDSTIYTRGYFSSQNAKSRSLTSGTLYFRTFSPNIKVSISYLSDLGWISAVEAHPLTSNVLRFNIGNKNRVNSESIPLRVTVHHGGSRFELSGIRVNGEMHLQERV